MACGEGWCGVGGVGSTTREGRVSGRKSETGGRTTAQVKHLFSTPANSSVRDRVKPVATAYHPIETDRIRTSEDLYHLSTYPPTRFTHLRPPTTSPGERIPAEGGERHSTGFFPPPSPPSFPWLKRGTASRFTISFFLLYLSLGGTQIAASNRLFFSNGKTASFDSLLHLFYLPLFPLLSVSTPWKSTSHSRLLHCFIVETIL